MILALNKPTVLILTNGGALSTEGFDQEGGLHNKGASAIVEAFNPNVVGAKAVAALLFGQVNTWGKLPYTIYPESYTNAIAMNNFDMTQSPGRTYRYYKGAVNYQFGHGLSYTNFSMHCEMKSKSVACTVTNTGEMDGDEVVMMFVRPLAAVRAAADHILPIKKLVGFDRVRLGKNGGKKILNFAFDDNTFASSTSAGDVVVYKGDYELVFWRGNGDEVVFTVNV